MAPSANQSTTVIWPLELEPEIHKMIEDRQTFDIHLVHIPTCVEKFLYLGSREAAHDKLLLQEFSIAVILSLCEQPIEEDKKIADIKYFHIPIDNNPQENLITRFNVINNLLEQCVRNRMPIMVHCTASFSACATVMSAYLMKRLRIDSDKTVFLMKKRSPLILPNYGFINQLNIYRKMNYTVETSHHEYRYFMLSHLLYSLRSHYNLDKGSPVVRRYDEPFTHYFNHVLVPDWLEERYTKALSYHCKHCHHYLFNELHVIKGPDWMANVEKENNCQTFFIEPMLWMFDGGLVMRSKILCPRCHRKLGEVNLKGSWCDVRNERGIYCSKHPTEYYNMFIVAKNCIVSSKRSCNVQPATVAEYQEILEKVNQPRY